MFVWAWWGQVLGYTEVWLVQVFIISYQIQKCLKYVCVFMNCNILLQHTTPPPHKIINFTQFCREQIIIKQLHYLYPPFSILHIMGSAIQKQWWLILNLYFDPPPSSTRWSRSRRSNSHNTASENSAPYFGSVDRVCKRSSVRDP